MARSSAKTRGQLVRIALEGSFDARDVDERNSEHALLEGGGRPGRSRPISQSPFSLKVRQSDD